MTNKGRKVWLKLPGVILFHDQDTRIQIAFNGFDGLVFHEFELHFLISSIFISVEVRFVCGRYPGFVLEFTGEKSELN